MKTIFFTLLTFLSITCFSQKFSFRYSFNDLKALGLSVPLNNVTHGSLMMVFSSEDDRQLVYCHYSERTKVSNNLYLYGGAGIHLGSRQVLRYKMDAHSIFLSGATATVGFEYNFGRVFLAADVMPRVDFPFFGGCEMHKHCGEATFGSLNLSTGINF